MSILILFGILSILIKKEQKLEKAKTELNYTEKSVFLENVFGTPVITEIIPESPARPMTKRLIKYIVIHETDNESPGAGAHNHATFLSKNNKSTTSWHYTVDDHEIYHHIPDNEIAHHAGDKIGNEYGIGIELCVNKDGNFEKTFENAAKLVASLIKEYNLTVDAITTHHDYTKKDCPHIILKENRLEEFKQKVDFYLTK